MSEQLYIIRYLSKTTHRWVMTEHEFSIKKDAEACLADKERIYNTYKWQIVSVIIKKVVDD